MEGSKSAKVQPDEGKYVTVGEDRRWKRLAHVGCALTTSSDVLNHHRNVYIRKSR